VDNRYDEDIGYLRLRVTRDKSFSNKWKEEDGCASGEHIVNIQREGSGGTLDDARILRKRINVTTHGTMPMGKNGA